MPAPVELIERIKEAGAFGRASLWLANLALAEASLQLYSNDPVSVNPASIMHEAFQKYFTRPLDADAHTEAAWHHLASYTACYYTYVWSCVIARELLRPFLEKGILTDPILAERYASEILVPGASRPAEDSLRAYLGRELSYDAFAAWVKESSTQ
jgi:thimet oligopeptidase